jgi:chromosome segregation ATPase
MITHIIFPRGQVPYTPQILKNVEHNFLQLETISLPESVASNVSTKNEVAILESKLKIAIDELADASSKDAVVIRALEEKLKIRSTELESAKAILVSKEILDKKVLSLEESFEKEVLIARESESVKAALFAEVEALKSKLLGVTTTSQKSESEIAMIAVKLRDVESRLESEKAKSEAATVAKASLVEHIAALEIKLRVLEESDGSRGALHKKEIELAATKRGHADLESEVATLTARLRSAPSTPMPAHASPSRAFGMSPMPSDLPKELRALMTREQAVRAEVDVKTRALSSARKLMNEKEEEIDAISVSSVD